ncbi:MAG: RluA family pseudouridine synthase [Planctomycetota bacterium]
MGRPPDSLRRLHTDNHLFVVVKAAGMPMVPDASGDASLFERVEEAVRVEKAKPGKAFLGIVQRLDRPVGGVVVFARTSKAAARLTEQFKSHTIDRRYLAVTEGVPAARRGSVEHALLKRERDNVVRVVDPDVPGAKAARTNFRVLATRDGNALVELTPHTGRSHQLRVALASLGTPIVGDAKYGATRPLEDRSIALFATTLALDHPTTRERLRFVAKPPARFAWRAFPEQLG